MVELECLSRVGFGCYRVTNRSSEHRNALRHALGLGCNLVDTASTYMDGLSETLVGEVLADCHSTDAFVITKAGYIQGGSLNVLRKLNEQGIATSEIVRFSGDSMYSIHPDFLLCQIEISLRRLRRSSLDGFLLHNPERYFNQPGAASCRDEYYSRIGRAFEFLEDMVSEGLIRYYGVSSNTLPSPASDSDSTDLGRLLALARSVACDNHFKLVQFPFNLLETGALEERDGAPSLVDAARRAGLRTLINRPLNASSPQGFIRLATYPDFVCDEPRDANLFERCRELIQKQLDSVGLGDNAEDYEIVSYLSQNWMQLGDSEVVARAFQDYFFPFLTEIYGGVIPESDKVAYDELYLKAEGYARMSLKERTTSVLRGLVRDGVIDVADPMPIQCIACQKYLDAGIDHVLVGMKKLNYVDDFVKYFRASG